MNQKKKKSSDIPLSLSLRLSPTGHIYLYTDSDSEEIVSPSVAEKIQSFFSVNESVGLLRLGLTHFNDSLPPSVLFWQQFSQLFITEICKHVDSDKRSVIPHIVVPHEEMNSLIHQAPFMRGMEYLTESTISLLWQGLLAALQAEVTAFDGSLSHYLSAFHTAWNTIGRVCFHLAENKNNSDYPFAFLATYTTGLSKTANTQHSPLGKALEEYAGKKSLLLSLLLPVNRAAENSTFLKNLVDSDELLQLT
jgi:non-specific serine/threonine protein kinase